MNDVIIENNYGDIRVENVNNYLNLSDDCGDIKVDNLYSCRDTLSQVQHHRSAEHAYLPCGGLGFTPDAGLERGTFQLPRVRCRWLQQLPVQPHLEFQESQQKAQRSHSLCGGVSGLLRREPAGAGGDRLYACECRLVYRLCGMGFAIHETYLLCQHRGKRGVCAGELYALQEVGIQGRAKTGLAVVSLKPLGKSLDACIQVGIGSVAHFFF